MITDNSATARTRYNTETNKQKTEIIFLADMEPQLRVPGCPDRILSAEFQYVHHLRVTWRRCKSSELFLACCPVGRHGHPAYRRHVL